MEQARSLSTDRLKEENLALATFIALSTTPLTMKPLIPDTMPEGTSASIPMYRHPRCPFCGEPTPDDRINSLWCVSCWKEIIHRDPFTEPS